MKHSHQRVASNLRRHQLRAARWLACFACVACSSKSNDGSASGPTTTIGATAGSVANPGQPASGSAGTSPSAGATAGRAAASGAAGMTTTTTTSPTAGKPGTTQPPAANGGSGGTPASSTGAAGMSTQSSGGASGSAGSTSAAGSGGMSGGSDQIYISPSGSDSNPGTEAMPLGSLAAAVMQAKAGSTIWVAPGTYKVSQTVALKTSGEDGKPISILAQEGERPVFDFSAQMRGSSSARGLNISGDYWHIKGLELIKAGDNCIHISGSHNTIERVVIHECDDTGLQITADSSDAANPDRAAYNTILNCDSYGNYDQENQGENADGFAAKLYIGKGNVFRGCRSWNNADDGWDLFASDDVVEIDSCWAISNGKLLMGGNNTNGDGNGFKLGGAAKDANQGGAVHKVKNCASIENAACGYTRNNNSEVPQLSMCGGRADGKGLLCGLSISGMISVSMSAADAIAAKRDADGNLPPIH